MASSVVTGRCGGGATGPVKLAGAFCVPGEPSALQRVCGLQISSSPGDNDHVVAAIGPDVGLGATFLAAPAGVNTLGVSMVCLDPQLAQLNCWWTTTPGRIRSPASATTSSNGCNSIAGTNRP